MEHKSTVRSVEKGFSNSALRIPYTHFWLDCGHCLSGYEHPDLKVGDAFECDGCARDQESIPTLREAIESPKFTHSRARPCGHDADHKTVYTIYIYHRDPESPSGVYLAAGGPEYLVAPLLREARKAGALSPTEGLR